MQVANGAAAPAAQQNGSSADTGFKLKFCTVCASNNNRFVVERFSRPALTS